jgi:hypothetical protein
MFHAFVSLLSYVLHSVAFFLNHCMGWVDLHSGALAAVAAIIEAVALVILARIEWNTQKAQSKCELRMEISLARKGGEADDWLWGFNLRVALFAQNPALCLYGTLRFRKADTALLFSTPSFHHTPKTLTPYIPEAFDIDKTLRSTLADATHANPTSVEITMEYVYQGRHRTANLEGVGWVDERSTVFQYSYADEPMTVISSKTLASSASQ